MNKFVFAAVALVVVGSLAYTPGLTQEAKGTKSAASKSTASRSTVSKSTEGRPVSKKSLASRTAVCRADCLPNNLQPSGIGVHGLYRPYNSFDPHLTSIEGRKQYAECVQKCLAPLPPVYVQRAVFALGLNWFGMTKESCLNCHSMGH
jgi:hypothetical protein